MTDGREVRALVAKLEAKGAAVTVRYDADGWIDTVRVAGFKGFGPYAMSPLSFAERAREVLAR